MIAKITQALADKTPLLSSGSASYSDSDLRGFMFIVGQTAKRYYVQTVVQGRQVRVKVGDHPMLTAKEAREQARQTLAAMKGGTNPNVEKRKALGRGTTLREALDLHLGAKTRSKATEEGYRYQVEHYLSDWLDRPLSALGEDRGAVRERHRRITDRHGGTTADYVMRVLRAVYNRGLREHPDLPPNPVVNVDFHGQKRRIVTVEPERLASWGSAVLGLSNPIRRDLHLFILLSGMRRTAAVEARIEHLDDARGVLRVPNPKGGTDRAFDLPLSAPMLALLQHRRKEAGKVKRNTPWLFPADSESGHIKEVKETSLGGLTGHALRHVYATAATEAGVPLAELKFLLNHSISSGGVTMGYVHPSIDHLRTWQALTTARLMALCGCVPEIGHWPPKKGANPSNANRAMVSHSLPSNEDSVEESLQIIR